MAELEEWKVMIFRASDGFLMGEIMPENLSFSMRLNDPNTINFDIDLSHGMAKKEFLEPYATDFYLMHGTDHLFAGIITGVDVDLRERSLSVAGLDYLHYLDKRIWQIDPQNPSIFAVVQSDVAVAINNLVPHVLLEPHSLDLIVSVDSVGMKVNFRIETGDTQSIFEHIKDLSEQDPGFDFDIETDFMDGIVTKELKVYAPRKGELNDFSFEQDKNIKDLSYTDVGITATWVAGLGAGSSKKIASVVGMNELQTKYRRLDATVDFGDILDTAVVARQTNAEAERIKRTTKENLSGVMLPELGVNLLNEVGLGDTVRVKGQTSYEYVDDYYRITEITVNSSQQGDFEVLAVFETASV